MMQKKDALGLTKPEEWELTALCELAKVVARTVDRESLLRTVLAQTLELLGFEAGGVYELDPLTGEAVLLVHQGLSDRFATAVQREQQIPSVILGSREPILWEDCRSAPQAVVPAMLEEGLCSAAVVPLVAPDRVMGLMNLATATPHLFTERERVLLATIGVVVGAGLARLRFHEELALFQRVANEAMDGVGLARVGGTIHYANSAMAALHGAHSPEQLIGKEVMDFLGGEDPQQVRQGIAQHLRQYGRWLGEVEVRGLDGIVRTVEASAVVHLDPEGELRWVSTRMRDLTEQRKRERLWRSLERAGTTLLRLRNASDIWRGAIRPLDEAGLRAVLMVLDERGKTLSVAAHNLGGAEALGELENWPWEPENNPTLHQILEDGQAIFVPNAAQWLKRGGSISPIARALAHAHAVHADDRAVAAPVYVQERPLGMLVVLGEGLAEQDRPPLGLFALQIAAALENARLFQRERRRRRQAETMQQVTAALASTLDRDKVLDLILEQVHEVLPYDSASFMLPDGDDLYVVAGRGYPDWEQVRKIRIGYLDDPDFRRVVEDREVVVVPDTHRHAHWISYPSVEYIWAWICVPVVADEEVKGVLNIDFARPHWPSEEELECLRAFAAQAGVALRNAGLYQETARLKEFNERLVQEMQEGLVLEDAAGILTHVNPAVERMLGREVKEIVGRHWSEFVAPEDLEEARRRSAARPEGKRDRYAAHLLRSDGSKVPCLISARPIFQEGQFAGTLTVVADISERLAREEQLRAAKEYLEGLLDNIPVGVLRINHRGEIVYMNPALEEMVGATLEDRMGLNVLETSSVLEVGVAELYRRGLEGEPLAPVDAWYLVPFFGRGGALFAGAGRAHPGCAGGGGRVPGAPRRPDGPTSPGGTPAGLPEDGSPEPTLPPGRPRLQQHPGTDPGIYEFAADGTPPRTPNPGGPEHLGPSGPQWEQTSGTTPGLCQRRALPGAACGLQRPGPRGNADTGAHHQRYQPAHRPRPRRLAGPGRPRRLAAGTDESVPQRGGGDARGGRPGHGHRERDAGRGSHPPAPGLSARTLPEALDSGLRGGDGPRDAAQDLRALLQHQSAREGIGAGHRVQHRAAARRLH